ncbi:hypothetical protein [Streptacidiphilus rugosus]|nr:hypothetical protein [Streptacidiphilus rugosus]
MTEWVLVAAQFTRPAGRPSPCSTDAPTAAATAGGNWWVTAFPAVRTAG